MEEEGLPHFRSAVESSQWHGRVSLRRHETWSTQWVVFSGDRDFHFYENDEDDSQPTFSLDSTFFRIYLDKSTTSAIFRNGFTKITICFQELEDAIFVTKSLENLGIRVKEHTSDDEILTPEEAEDHSDDISDSFLNASSIQSRKRVSFCEELDILSFDQDQPLTEEKSGQKSSSFSGEENVELLAILEKANLALIADEKSVSGQDLSFSSDEESETTNQDNPLEQNETLPVPKSRFSLFGVAKSQQEDNSKKLNQKLKNTLFNSNHGNNVLDNDEELCTNNGGNSITSRFKSFFGSKDNNSGVYDIKVDPLEIRENESPEFAGDEQIIKSELDEAELSKVDSDLLAVLELANQSLFSGSNNSIANVCPTPKVEDKNILSTAFPDKYHVSLPGSNTKVIDSPEKIEKAIEHVRKRSLDIFGTDPFVNNYKEYQLSDSFLDQTSNEAPFTSDLSFFDKPQQDNFPLEFETQSVESDTPDSFHIDKVFTIGDESEDKSYENSPLRLQTLKNLSLSSSDEEEEIFTIRRVKEIKLIEQEENPDKKEVWTPHIHEDLEFEIEVEEPSEEEPEEEQGPEIDKDNFLNEFNLELGDLSVGESEFVILDESREVAVDVPKSFESAVAPRLRHLSTESLSSSTSSKKKKKFLNFKKPKALLKKTKSSFHKLKKTFKSSPVEVPENPKYAQGGSSSYDNYDHTNSHSGFSNAESKISNFATSNLSLGENKKSSYEWSNEDLNTYLEESHEEQNELSEEVAELDFDEEFTSSSDDPLKVIEERNEDRTTIEDTQSEVKSLESVEEDYVTYKKCVKISSEFDIDEEALSSPEKTDSISTCSQSDSTNVQELRKIDSSDINSLISSESIEKPSEDKEDSKHLQVSKENSSDDERSEFVSISSSLAKSFEANECKDAENIERTRPRANKFEIDDFNPDFCVKESSFPVKNLFREESEDTHFENINELKHSSLPIVEKKFDSLSVPEIEPFIQEIENDSSEKKSLTNNSHELKTLKNTSTTFRGDSWEFFDDTKKIDSIVKDKLEKRNPKNLDTSVGQSFHDKTNEQLNYYKSHIFTDSFITDKFKVETSDCFIESEIQDLCVTVDSFIADTAKKDNVNKAFSEADYLIETSNNATDCFKIDKLNSSSSEDGSFFSEERKENLCPPFLKVDKEQYLSFEEPSVESPRHQEEKEESEQDSPTFLNYPDERESVKEFRNHVLENPIDIIIETCDTYPDTYEVYQEHGEILKQKLFVPKQTLTIRDIKRSDSESSVESPKSGFPKIIPLKKAFNRLRRKKKNQSSSDLRLDLNAEGEEEEDDNLALQVGKSKFYIAFEDFAESVDLAPKPPPRRRKTKVTSPKKETIQELLEPEPSLEFPLTGPPTPRHRKTSQSSDEILVPPPLKDETIPRLSAEYFNRKPPSIRRHSWIPHTVPSIDYVFRRGSFQDSLCENWQPVPSESERKKSIEIEVSEDEIKVKSEQEKNRFLTSSEEDDEDQFEDCCEELLVKEKFVIPSIESDTRSELSFHSFESEDEVRTNVSYYNRFSVEHSILRNQILNENKSPSPKRTRSLSDITMAMPKNYGKMYSQYSASVPNLGSDVFHHTSPSTKYKLLSPFRKLKKFLSGKKDFAVLNQGRYNEIFHEDRTTHNPIYIQEEMKDLTMDFSDDPSSLASETPPPSTSFGREITMDQIQIPGALTEYDLVSWNWSMHSGSGIEGELQTHHNAETQSLFEEGDKQDLKGGHRSSGSKKNRKKITPPDSTPTIVGTLYVTLSPDTRWKRRYLSVIDDLLLIFSKVDSKYATAKVRLGNHSLSSASDDIEDQFSFKITKRDKTTLYIKADNITEYDTWTSVLREEMARYSKKPEAALGVPMKRESKSSSQEGPNPKPAPRKAAQVSKEIQHDDSKSKVVKDTKVGQKLKMQPKKRSTTGDFESCSESLEEGSFGKEDEPKIIINQAGEWMLEDEEEEESIPEEWKEQNDLSVLRPASISVSNNEKIENLIWSTIEEESESEEGIKKSDERKYSPNAFATQSPDSGLADDSSNVSVKNIAKIWEKDKPPLKNKNFEKINKKWQSMPDLKQPKRLSPASEDDKKKNYPTFASIPIKCNLDEDDRDVCTLVPIKERLKMFETLSMKALKEKKKLWSSMPSLDHKKSSAKSGSDSKGARHFTTHYHRSPSLVIRNEVSAPLALVGSSVNSYKTKEGISSSNNDDYELTPLKDRMNAYVRQASKSPEGVRAASPTIEAMKGFKKCSVSVNVVEANESSKEPQYFEDLDYDEEEEDEEEEVAEDPDDIVQKKVSTQDQYLRDPFDDRLHHSGDETESIASSNTSASTVISVSKINTQNNINNHLNNNVPADRVIPTYSWNDDSNGEIYNENRNVLYVVENGKEFPLTSLSERKQIFDPPQPKKSNMNFIKQQQQIASKQTTAGGKSLTKNNLLEEQKITKNNFIECGEHVIKSANIPYIKEEEDILQNINVVKALKEKFSDN